MTKYAVDDASTHSFLQPESLFPRHREYGPLHLVDILVRTVPGIFFEDLSLSLWDSDPVCISWLKYLKSRQMSDAKSVADHVFKTKMQIILHDHTPSECQDSSMLQTILAGGKSVQIWVAGYGIAADLSVCL